MSTCDVLVVGSGAGALSAAVTAAKSGLHVLVIEKAAVWGGTTAFSGGWLWVPNAPHAVAAGHAESSSQPKAYLNAAMGAGAASPLIDVYLEEAPKMAAFFEAHTAVEFLPGARAADFYGEAPGSATGWRSLVAKPYDGSLLGAELGRLRAPLYETTLWGMGIGAGDDVNHFFRASRSLRSAWHVGKRLGRYALHRQRFGQSAWLVNGQALVARLLRSALDAGVRLQASTRLDSLERDGQGWAAHATTLSGSLKIHAKAVVLATGGFAHDSQFLSQQLGDRMPHYCAAPDANTGDGIRAATALGAAVPAHMAEPCAWTPVSLAPRRDGSLGRFPHLMERGKPGLIAVAQDGKRFTNEGAPYYTFMRDFWAHVRGRLPAQAWLIVDHAFIRRYGLGAVKPFPFALKPWLNNGYLKRGDTLDALALACELDSGCLKATIERYNQDARAGIDTQFERGSNLYQCNQGDAAHAPNPCIAPIEHGPFYAVAVYPGSLGTFTGLATNEHAQVLNIEGEAIANLYAAGNDMNSIFGGFYPSGGITLGPAMTFGYLAGRHIGAQLNKDSA